MPLFPNIDALEAYVDQYIIANGNNEITGPQANVSLNGCIEFIRQSPLNHAKAQVESTTGGVTALAPVVVFSNAATPANLTYSDNIYHEYVFINMGPLDIPLTGSLGYYNLSGGFETVIPSNSVVNIFKATNDLWVLGSGSSGGGGGSVQKEPKSYKVGTTVGAPTAGEFTWTLPIFQNSYVVLFINRIPIDIGDMEDGGPYIEKTLGDTFLTIFNYSTGWNVGDVLTYILITP